MYFDNLFCNHELCLILNLFVNLLRTYNINWGVGMHFTLGVQHKKTNFDQFWTLFLIRHHFEGPIAQLAQGFRHPFIIRGGGRFANLGVHISIQGLLKQQFLLHNMAKSGGGPCTGYSFWDRLRNFLHKFTWIVLSVHKLNKLGKFW